MSVKTKNLLLVKISLAVLLLAATAFVQPASFTADAQTDNMPPEFFQEFIKFYSSGDLNNMWRYVNADRGLIQNGILMTFDEVESEFKALGPEIGKIDFIRLIFNFGEFLSDNYYRADTKVEYRTAGYTQTVPTVFVFEKIDDEWYLVQSEKVEFVEQYRNRGLLTVGYILPDVALKTNTGRLYTSAAAAKNHKATLLYFFTVLDLYREENTRFFMELVGEFGRNKDIYVFGVTDDDVDIVDNWMAADNLKFVWLNDEKSLLHYDLGILEHPELLLLNQEGRLVMMARWQYDLDKVMDPKYHPPAQDLIKKRINEVLANPVGG